MGRQRKTVDLNSGMDSFLDLMFNVIGILVLIVAFAAVAASTTRQVTKVRPIPKKKTSSKQINIICSGNRAAHLDRKDTGGMESLFTVRLEGSTMLVLPQKGLPGWITLEELSLKKNRLVEILEKRLPDEHDISLLIYQDSFKMAARVEEIARKRGYHVRHVFLEEEEPLTFSRQKAYS